MSSRPLSPDEATGRLHALLSRGHATAREVLALEYGDAPVPGLHVDPLFDVPTPLHFHASFHEGDGIECSHNKGWNPWDVLKPHRIEARLSSDESLLPYQIGHVSHEAFHALHQEACLLDALVAPERYPAQSGKDIFNGFHPSLETLVRAGETEQKTAARYQDLDALLHKGGANGDYENIYYLQESELLARMNTLIASQAGKEGRIPTSRAELEPIAALIRDEEATRPRSGHTFTAREAAWNLREGVLDKIPEARRERFYRDVLPELYGSTLEVLGDPQGRAKMGLEPGPVYARNAAKRLLYETAHPDQAWPAEKWSQMIAKLEPDTLKNVLWLATREKNPTALPLLLEAHRQAWRPKMEPGQFAGQRVAPEPVRQAGVNRSR
ncbi:MAG: hypothetical protein PW734_08240 [Verrucomicrobium sp.]|nr:hypothetical protein [Verrucomicrobium sp.]